jgi:hypothetical protein
MAQNRNRHWTPEDDIRLCELLASRVSFSVISVEFGRDLAAVKARAQKNFDESLSLIHRPLKIRKTSIGEPGNPGQSRMFARLGIYQGPRPSNSSPSS